MHDHFPPKQQQNIPHHQMAHSRRLHHRHQQQHFRLPSPPPCCSSGTNSSSLSQPISLDFGPPIHIMPKENWLDPPRRHQNHRRLLPLKNQNKSNRLHCIGQFATLHNFNGPINLDALIGRSTTTEEGEEDEEDGEGNISQERMVGSVFSTSEDDEEDDEDLTTSDSEICRFGARARAEQRRRMEAAKKFGKFPSLSTIYPDNSSFSLDDNFDLNSLMASSREKARRKVAANQGKSNQLLQNGKETNENWRRGEEPKMADKMQSTQSAPRTPQRIPTLEMVEEISPVLPPPPDPEEDFDVPPLPRPLQLGRGGNAGGGEWRPLQTSTLTNFHAITQIPKTNPRQQFVGGAAAMKGQTTNLPQMPQMDPPRSLFDPFFPKQCSSAPISSARPEQFNLPSALANSFGIRGILFIQVAISGPSLLLVHVRNAALFLKNTPASCYVKVEIRRSPSNRKRTKYDHRFRSKQTVECRESCWPEFFDDFQFKVSPVHLKYGDKLGLALYATNTTAATQNGQQSTMGQPVASTIAPAAELLGRMSFSLRKFFRLAKQHQQQQFGGGMGSHHRLGEEMEPIQVCQGGFFLLPDRLGQQSHLSQDNILHRKYYDEIGATAAAIGGCSSLSSNSSFGSSPFKMMSEPEWPPSAMPPSLGLGGGGRLRGPTNLGSIGSQKSNNIQQPMQQGIGQNRVLDSSQSSSSQSGVDCKRRAPPPPLPSTGATFPSVTTDTTTSDFTSSALTTFSSTNDHLHHQMANDSFSSGCAEVGGGGIIAPGGKFKENGTMPSVHIQRPEPNALVAPPRPQQPQHYVRAQSQQPTTNEQKQLPSPNKKMPKSPTPDSQCSLNATSAAMMDNAVRRVASFTHSPTLLVNPQLYKKRNSVTAGTALTDRMPRKHLMGPLGKTLHFLKSKLDFSSLSASVLCPSKEECRLWQESFEALLNHKYGCMLFREFLQIEFSQENLEFWLECEEFKRMNEAKKQALQKKAHQIYNNYIKPLATKEVNLDSETRMKTEAALERQPLRTDIFKMAQNKIEQLMAKDSYPRFLKSEQYMELLNEREAAEKSGNGSGGGFGQNASALANGLLRVASAKEGGAKKPVKSGRSPSLSPILSGGQSRWGRRNTCSPASPTTLQIPSAIQE